MESKTEGGTLASSEVTSGAAVARCTVCCVTGGSVRA